MKRLILNAAIWVFFLLIMSFQYLPKILHELGGVIWVVVVFLHLAWNRQWFRSLLQGKWATIRGVAMLINILLILSSITVILSGICISNHVFKGMIPLALQRNIVIHQLHVSVPYLMLILMGLHIGLHWQGMWQRVIKALRWNSNSLPYRAGCYFGVLMLFLGGIYGSLLNRIGDRLQLKHIFATAATQASWDVYVLMLIGIMGMYAVVSHTIQRKAKE